MAQYLTRSYHRAKKDAMSHNDEYYDADRYDSLIGREPKRPNYDAIRRRLERERIKNDPGETPFDTTSGAAVSRQGKGKPALQLFGGLWHEGEVALLTGPAASGKSVLAVQIADQIARGEEGFFPIQDRKSKIQNRKVLYVDFAQTAAQFAERYTIPHPIPGKLPLRHRFPNKFIRAGLGSLEAIPDRFRKEPHRYFQYWLYELIEQTEARVLVLDNLTYLAGSLTSHPSAAATAKNLKWWAQRYHLSILATVNTKSSAGSPPYQGGVDSGRPLSSRLGGTLSPARKPATLADIAAASPLTDLADTVFTISPSTLGPDLRYIKHLKCRREVEDHDASTVIVGQLGRSEQADPPATALIPHSALRSPHSVSPFLALTYAGLSPESIHLTNPFAQLRREKCVSQHPRSAIPNPKSKMTTAEMLLSREYWRYLER
jgi:energy-coupling factor transporter ATP-binding protein EcfA2